MKRLFPLALALILCLFTTNCKQESDPTLEFGIFHVQDGIKQNSHVTLVLETTELIAPVTSLSYTLYDNCDFRVSRIDYSSGNNLCKDRLEIYQDGTWQEAPRCGSNSTLGFETSVSHNPPAPTEHSAQTYSMELSLAPGTPENPDMENPQLIRYKPLEPGIYRVRVLYTLSGGPESIDTSNTEAVAYFTVSTPR